MQLRGEPAVLFLQLGDLPVGRECCELGVDLVELVVESVELCGSALVFVAKLGDQLVVAEPSQPAGGVVEPSADAVQLLRVSGAVVGRYRAVLEFAAQAAAEVGTYVHVITDDAPAARTTTTL